MKTSYKFIVCTLLMIISSCDPDRVDSPPLSLTEDNYFTNAGEFRTVVAGIYGKLYDYYFTSAPGGWPNSLWLLPGDDLTETNGVRTPEELFDGGMNSTNGRIEWIFDKTYEMIQKCNVLIQKTNTIDYSGFDNADEVGYMKGEALFLRAYAYFNLFNIYGNVPLITERLGAENTNTPKSDKLDVLGQVITDARDAIAILPESWQDSYRGRATKNSARGLLVKALVFRADYSGNAADYTEAISIFNTITATLLPRYLDNFDAAVENNEESLFEVQASAGPNLNNVFLYNDGEWRGVEDMSVFRGMLTPAGKGLVSDLAGTRFLITNKLFNNFGTDPRISYFLRADDNEGGRIFQKYTADELDQRVAPFESSLNNERVLRYADVVLLAAEAQLKSGNPSAAITSINDIRTRARNWGSTSGEGDGIVPVDLSTSETNSVVIMQWIMDERFVELAGEGHRWWDLKRWNASGDIDLAGWEGGDDEFSTHLASPVQFDIDKHLLFPIPQTEIERNDAIIDNNPGY